MNKSIAFLISVLLFLVAAQSSFAQMRSDPSGTWGGTMTTEVGTSGIELTLARKTSGWNATMKLRTIQGQELAPVISEHEKKGAQIFCSPLNQHQCGDIRGGDWRGKT